MTASVAVVAASLLAACAGGSDAASPTTPTTPAPPQVGSVSVAVSAATLQVGATLTASAEVKSTTGSVLTGRSITWASSNAAFATITDGGLITGVAPGSVTISATSEGRTGTVTLTVIPAPVNSVVLSLASPQIFIGRTTQSSVVLRDERNAILTGRTVSYASSNPAVASVDGAGVITGAASGTAVITATSEGKSATAEVRVTAAPVSNVTVTLGQSTVFQGATTTATAVLRDDLGATLSGREITWSSSNPQVATVSNGTIVAVSVGTSTITATSEGRSGSAVLTVVPVPVATVQLALPRATMAPGTTMQAVATPRDAGGNALAGRVIQWGTTNPAVATISATGQISAVGIGTATITATSEGQTGQATVQVLVPVASVVINGSIRVKVGDSYAYTATARAADGTILERPVTWRVREAARASMSAGGIMVPLQTGTITIVAVIDGSEWDASYSAYDWVSFASNGIGFLSLESDAQVANRFGTLQYTEVLMSCGPTARFYAWVRVPHMITQSGLVTYSLDGGTPTSRLWEELSPNYNTLWVPGASSTVKSFAQELAAARRFGLAFSEFNGTARAMTFRLTGLSERLPSLLALCPNSIVQGGQAQAAGETADTRESLARTASRIMGSPDLVSRDDVRRRAESVPTARSSPLLTQWPLWQVPDATPARRAVPIN
jgi:uncharacterized protein YjdB